MFFHRLTILQDSIVASLSRLPKLHRLTLSGGIDDYGNPFFPRAFTWAEPGYIDFGDHTDEDFGKYAPESFEIAARDLANGCRTLDTVTFGYTLGDLVIRGGLSVRIVRERPDGEVKELRRVRAWGSIIGKEEEW